MGFSNPFSKWHENLLILGGAQIRDSSPTGPDYHASCSDTWAIWTSRTNGACSVNSRYRSILWQALAAESQNKLRLWSKTTLSLHEIILLLRYSFGCYWALVEKQPTIGHQVIVWPEVPITNWFYMIHQPMKLSTDRCSPLSDGSDIYETGLKQALKAQVCTWGGSPDAHGPCYCYTVFFLSIYGLIWSSLW